MCRHFNLNTISLSSRFSLFLSVTVLDILTAGTVVLIIFFYSIFIMVAASNRGQPPDRPSIYKQFDLYDVNPWYRML